jgi:superfamily I DNA/RNA helicase
MGLKPKVALSIDFLSQLGKLPSNVHTKVLKWSLKFQADPTSPGINYEKIQGAYDENLRSIRIDQDWRGIVFKPVAGDVYVLLYVDHHDEAYRWAERKRLTINPVTGAMQLVFVEQAVEAQAPSTNVPVVEASIFATLDDRDLMSLGVPESSLHRVRAISTEIELDANQSSLPVEAYEGLFLLFAGETVSQILHDRETRVDKAVNVTDFAAALSTAESKSRFVIVEDDEAMRTILNAPLEQWRIFLHPTQTKLAVGDRSGPVRVLGGAGTGKTVLAMHRAKWLAENRATHNKKILFTTFTKNLALDIEDNLKTLCSNSTMEKLEVKSLDSWVHGFMRSRKLEHKIVFDRSKEGALQAWQAALAVKRDDLDLSEDFYEEELEQVILAFGVCTREEYRAVRRIGRGVILSRAKRDAVWPVFEEYRGQLASRKLKEVDDAYRDVATLLLQDAERNGDSMLPFSAIVVDEMQDFGPQALRLLRAMVPHADNDLFFVGDGHQRIYSRHRAAMSKCGINIKGRSRKLYLNYRTTDEIRRTAVALLEGCSVDDLDDGPDETRKYKSLSHGPIPEIKNLELADAQAEALSTVNRWRIDLTADQDRSICIIANTKKVRDNIAAFFRASKMSTSIIDANQNLSRDSNVVHFATMHRAKGLEFDCVIVFAPASSFVDIADSGTERKLLYVALTRAKREALLVEI